MQREVCQPIFKSFMVYFLVITWLRQHKQRIWKYKILKWDNCLFSNRNGSAFNNVGWGFIPLLQPTTRGQQSWPSFRYSVVSSVIHLHMQSLVFICVFMPLNNFGPCLCVFLPAVWFFPTVFRPLSSWRFLNSCSRPSKNGGTAALPHTLFRFITHVLLCSARPPSSPLVSVSYGIGLNNGMMWRLLFGGFGGKWNPPQGDL